MRVLLISANTERINMTVLPLGLALVAAATRRHGHEVSYLDLLAAEDTEAAIAGAVAGAVPQVIGVSVRNVDDQQMDDPAFLLDGASEVVAACRRLSSAPIVVGGAGYSIFADAALVELGADYGVRGEGEEVFPQLVDCLQQGADPGRLPGVHRPGQAARPPCHAADLGQLPPPAEELWAEADLDDPGLWMPVQSRRGCPLDCSYCATGLIEGRRIRTRPPERVFEDVARLAHAGATRLQLVDSIFNLPPSYAIDLCQRLASLSLPLQWRAILYPHQVSPQLVAAMARAGCVEVSLGFESGNEQMLQRLNKRFTCDELRQISAMLADAGIRRFGFLLLGAPGETRSSVTESLDFAEDLDLETVRVTVGIRIYPETPLAETAAAEGLIKPGEDLLRPSFYLAPDVEGWIDEVVAARSQIPGFIRPPAGMPGAK
jgi:radical SAM superfamily enzyme YgiQ (UPF0313 family)